MKGNDRDRYLNPPGEDPAISALWRRAAGSMEMAEWASHFDRKREARHVAEVYAALRDLHRLGGISHSALPRHTTLHRTGRPRVFQNSRTTVTATGLHKKLNAHFGKKGRWNAYLDLGKARREAELGLIPPVA